MRAAIDEARRGSGATSPNPTVGAVLVIQDRVVSRGFHRRAGAAHAEIECIRSFAQPIPADATLYITLEPCSTSGRTGPCTGAIISAGIRNVVIGAIDPNPRHSGSGINILRKAGLNVRTDVLAEECAALNEAFNKWIQARMPFVIAKCGMSLDGRLTRRDTEPRWITSAAARRDAQRLRASVDAILVGGETVRRDNPRLTVRGIRNARQPWRVVLTRSGGIPKSSNVLSDPYADRTLVFKGKSLRRVLAELGKKEITSVLIEGGGHILGQALDAQLVDKVQIYLGPMITGGPVIAFAGRGAATTAKGARLAQVSYRRIGQDICITGYPVYASSAVRSAA